MSLDNIGWGSSAWDLPLGIFGAGSLVWDLWLGIFHWGSCPWDLWLGIFGMGSLACDHRLGISSLGSWNFRFEGLRRTEAGGTLWAELGGTQPRREQPLTTKRLSKNHSRQASLWKIQQFSPFSSFCCVVMLSLAFPMAPAAIVSISDVHSG